MKGLLTILTLFFLLNSFSQDRDIFVCSVGLVDDPKYPIEIKEFKSGNDIKPLSNGKRFPVLSRLKTNIDSEEGSWILIKGVDTTSINKTILKAKGSQDAIFTIKGNEFSCSIDTKGMILKMNDDLIIFREENNNEWKLLRIE
jgi:hypothetical protein